MQCTWSRQGGSSEVFPAELVRSLVLTWWWVKCMWSWDTPFVWYLGWNTDHSESGKFDMDTKLTTNQHLDSVACQMTNYNFIFQLQLPFNFSQCGYRLVFDVSGFLAMLDKCILCTACCIMWCPPGVLQHRVRVSLDSQVLVVMSWCYCNRLPGSL